MARSNQSIPIISLIFLLCLTASCSHKMSRTATEQNFIFYPPPPDTARIQYLTSINSSEDIAGKPSAFSRFVTGETEPSPVVKPYGIANSKGKVYICDTGIDGLVIIDLDNHSFSYFIPSGKGQLLSPLNCSLDEEGNIYVADGERQQVVIFDREGNFIDAIGEKEKFKPTDVFVSRDLIWVSNAKNNNVIAYGRTDRQIALIVSGSGEGSPGYLYSPVNIFVAQDKLYVSDFGDFKIKIFDLEGNYLTAVGSYGTSPGQFARPKGIAADKESNLYVVDAGFENVQVFNNEGKVLMFFGGPYKGPGDMWLPAKVSVDYNNAAYFKKYVDPVYELDYLIWVTNQFGPDKINVYGSLKLKR